MQAHITRMCVVMDIAAFKVSHSVGLDRDATTALRAARVNSKSIGAMEEMSGKVQNASTHPLGRKNHEHAHNSQSVQGAMEDMSGKVQNANTHILQCQNHEHAHSSRSVQGPVQWGDG